MAVETTAGGIEAVAVARYVRLSPRKARLVADLIRGRRVEQALVLLRFTRKRAARDLAKVLRSAVANAQQRAEELGVPLDVDRLVVSRCVVNEGPRLKRWRAAPYGRALPYVHRMSHLEVAVAEAPAAGGSATAKAPRGRRG